MVVTHRMKRAEVPKWNSPFFIANQYFSRGFDKKSRFFMSFRPKYLCVTSAEVSHKYQNKLCVTSREVTHNLFWGLLG